MIQVTFVVSIVVCNYFNMYIYSYIPLNFVEDVLDVLDDEQRSWYLGPNIETPPNSHQRLSSNMLRGCSQRRSSTIAPLYSH